MSQEASVQGNRVNLYQRFSGLESSGNLAPSRYSMLREYHFLLEFLHSSA